MPAIKKSDVLEDSVKKAFDDLNSSVKLSVDLLVLMTKSAKDINASLGNGSNISQVAAAQSKYSEQLERQIKHETDLVRLDRQRLALSEAKRKADEARANSAIAANDKQAKSAANLAAINARAAAAQTRADDARANAAIAANDRQLQSAANLAAANARAAAAQTRADAATASAAAAAQRQQTQQAEAARKAAAAAARNGTLYAQEQARLTSLREAARHASLQYGENSREARRLAREVQNLDGRLSRLDSSLGQHQRNVGNYSSAFKGLGMGLMGAFGITAGIAGIVAGIGSVVKKSMEFEKALSSLRAITGVSAKEMGFFKNAALAMSGSTMKSATEIVKAFELVGSKAPELLKNKEALASVTEEAIRLSEASGGTLGLEESVGAVTAAMNTFGISALEAGRIANVFAAGSKEGSAEVAGLAEAFKNVGTVADGANMSLEETVAMLEVLGEKSIYGAEAGTKMRGSILKLQQAGKGYASGQFNLRDALIEVNNELDKQGSALEKDALRAKYFGAENITVGSIMVANVDKFDSLTKAVTGTTTAVEQQAIQNDNLSGSVDKLGNSWDSWMLSLSGSNGLLKKGADLLNNYLKTFNFITQSISGKGNVLASEGMSKLNAELSALTVVDQIDLIEKKLIGFNQTLKASANQAADEGTGTWRRLIDGYETFSSALIGQRNVTARDVFASTQLLIEQTEAKLEALRKEKKAQEEMVPVVTAVVDTEKEASNAKGTTVEKTRDLIKIQEQLLQQAQNTEAATEQEIVSRKFKVEAIEAEIKRLKELGSIQQVAAIDVSGIEAAAASQMDVWQKESEDELQLWAETEAAKTAMAEQAAKDRTDILLRYNDVMFEGVGQLTDVMFENMATSREGDLDNQIEYLQARLDNDNLDDEQRGEIQKEIDQKEKERKIKNAKAEKQEALMKLGIDTLMAVAKIKAQAAILASNPLTLAYVPAALAEIPFVLISSAFAAAAIAARKIPEYATGTDYHTGGFALVGDGGKAELVETPSGAKFLTPDTDTVMNLPRGSKVTAGEDVANRLTELTRRELISLAVAPQKDLTNERLLSQLIDEQKRTRRAIENNKPHQQDVTGKIRTELLREKMRN